MLMPTEHLLALQAVIWGSWFFSCMIGPTMQSIRRIVTMTQKSNFIEQSLRPYFSMLSGREPCSEIVNRKHHVPMTAHVGSFPEAAACCAQSAVCNIQLPCMHRGHKATPVGTDYALGCCARPPLQVITPRQGAMSVETHK